jgi:MerR family Zn(II)-responsive transcriptional regulator of zntA
MVSYSTNPTLKIGALAKQANETVATIRFWTKEGLLQITETTPSNYALYSIDMIDQCKQIQTLKAKRYTLAEIKERLAG